MTSISSSRPAASVRRRVAAVTLGLGLVAAACGDDAGSDGDGSSGRGDPPDDLTIATGFTIENLVPLDKGLWAPEFGYGDLLMQPVPGDDPAPWVLESLSTEDDTVWQLELRDGVTFQNGNGLDAEVLADLIDHHVEHNPTVSSLLPDADAEAVGPLTVELSTGEPVPALPSLLATEGMFILFDLATYEELADSPDDLVGAGIYTGPYEVVRLTPDVMELEPNEHYYGGEPALSAVTVLFVDDEQARIRAVQSGEADLALYPPTSAARRLDGRSDAHYLVQPEGEATVGHLLFVNQHAPALADVRVRQAIRHAVDDDVLAEDVMNGLYDRSPGLYPAFLPYSLDLAVFDPAAAADLLDDAGWERDGDGIRSRDGEDLTLRAITYPQQPDIGVIAVAMQDQLGAVGIELEIVEVDGNYDAMADPDGWELGFSNEHMLDITGANPVRPLLLHYHSDGQWNFGGIDDPDLDALIDEVAVAGRDDEEHYHGLLEDIQRTIVDDGAYGWFVALKRTPVVVGPDLQDYPIPPANLWLLPYS